MNPVGLRAPRQTTPSDTATAPTAEARTQSQQEAHADVQPAECDERLKKLMATEGLKGRIVGGVALGALSVPTGFDYVCTQQASYPGNRAFACAISAPTVKFGTRALRAIPALVSAPLAYVAPSSQYVTQLPSKCADVTSAMVAWSLEGIPWANVKALVSRLPDAYYPVACDPTAALTQCPDALSWERASRLAPYYQGTSCVVVGIAVGAYMGQVIWRDGVRHMAGLPIIDASALPLDAVASAVPWVNTIKKSAVPPYNLAVNIARAEVARRDKLLQLPAADESTALLGAEV